MSAYISRLSSCTTLARMMSSPITKLVEEIAKAFTEAARAHVTEPFWVTHYGAVEIHPKHLAYWICVKSDAERDRLVQSTELKSRHRSILEEFDYPADCRRQVAIGFESQETVDRESGGNWWHHWK